MVLVTKTGKVVLMDEESMSLEEVQVTMANVNMAWWSAVQENVDPDTASKIAVAYLRNTFANTLAYFEAAAEENSMDNQLKKLLDEE
jgi:hypothetical protein